MASLNVNPSQQDLNVSILSDKSTAQPGEDVTYTVVTKDLSGQPVQADVSLALIDKAALALAPSNSLTPLAAFYPLRSLGVANGQLDRGERRRFQRQLPGNFTRRGTQRRRRRQRQ